MKKERVELAPECKNHLRGVKDTVYLLEGKWKTIIISHLYFGVAIYSTIKNGVGIFTLLPLVFVAFTINAWKKDNQALKDELKSRNLI